MSSNLETISNIDQKHPIKSGMLLPVIKKISGILILVGAVMIFGQLFSGNDQIPANNIQALDLQPKPTRLKIAKLNIDAPIVNLGLNADQTLEVPKKKSEVGWYINSPSPGGRGPAILVGHLDDISGAAVFYKLRELKPGDEVEVQREDGSIAVFRIENSEQYSQDNFPTEKVYGTIDYSGIRLITCSGSYNLLQGRYSDNLVVYGSLLRITENNS